MKESTMKQISFPLHDKTKVNLGCFGIFNFPTQLSIFVFFFLITTYLQTFITQKSTVIRHYLSYLVCLGVK